MTVWQVLTLADGQAAQIAQDAREYAVAVREAAEREAAATTRQAAHRAEAIREAAEREAAELRTRLDSMVGDLGRAAAYVTERLAAPALLATAPALPAIAPAMPPVAPTVPPVAPRVPQVAPVLPVTRPNRSGPRPARPDTRRAKPDNKPATPTAKPQKSPRQRQAMRIATCATATLMLIAAVSGATETGLHGFKFFVFRAGGVGQTAGNESDQQFLARQAAAAHHVAEPKGRHARKAHEPAAVHNK